MLWQGEEGFGNQSRAHFMECKGTGIFKITYMADQQKQYYLRQHDAVYGLGFIGALIYFISHATSFGMGVLGLLKALVWPAFMVYKLFEFLLK